MAEVKKRKVGRPKKIDLSNITFDEHDPASVLKALGFNPIAELISTLKECDSKLRWVKKQPKPSQAAIAALMATKRALNSDLLAYGFRKIPEKLIQENHNFSFGIELTDTDGSLIEVEKVVPVNLDETRH